MIPLPLTILFCEDDLSWRLAKELEEAFDNIFLDTAESVLSNTPADTDGLVLLLYLNKDTFLDNDIKDVIKNVMDKGIKHVLVHEKDFEKGGCNFSLIMKRTHTDLLNPPYSIYNNIAVDVYTPDVYQKVSLHLLLRKLGGRWVVDGEVNGGVDGGGGWWG